MNVRFLCPNCEYPARVNLPGPGLWQCPACDHRLQLDGEIDKNHVPQCVVCGNTELYKKKDFPHRLGMTVLVLACITSFITYLWYQKILTWGILIGTAVFDGLLYMLVGDVIVCYRCQAHYRGLNRNSDHQPFDLGIGERYRQEQIRREQLDAEKKVGGKVTG